MIDLVATWAEKPGNPGTHAIAKDLHADRHKNKRRESRDNGGA